MEGNLLYILKDLKYPDQRNFQIRDLLGDVWEEEFFLKSIISSFPRKETVA